MNLISEPWISALYPDGKSKYISLQTLFADWSHIVDINGTTSLNTHCINRLLQIIVMRVTGGIETPEELKALLADHSLGIAIQDYLHEHRYRFSLNDQEMPFLQCPDAGDVYTPDAQSVLQLWGVAEKDIFFQKREPDFIDLAQASLRLVFAGPSGCAANISTNASRQYADQSLLVNKVFLTAKQPSLRETLLVNLPLGKLDSSDVAPWEKPIHSSASVNVVPQSTFQLLCLMNRRLLYYWENGSLAGIYSGTGDKLQSDFAAKLPELGWLSACPLRVTKDDGLDFLKPSVSHSAWSDVRVVLDASIVRSPHIKPAPITQWWKQLVRKGVIQSELTIETTAVVMKGATDPTVLETSQHSLTVPASLLDADGSGRQIREMYRFIEHVCRQLFQPGYQTQHADGSDIKKSERRLIHMRPLNLLQRFGGFISSKESRIYDKLQMRFPLGSQFLAIAEVRFDEMLQETLDHPDRTAREWQERATEWKSEILELAMRLWNQTLFSIPLTSPAYIQAVGYSNRKIQFIRSCIRKEHNLK